jgi:transposase
MHPISSAQHSTIISLLHKHYSVCEIQSRTGIGKSTIGRVKKGVDTDKENNKGGRPSMLSPCDKQSILCQITTAKLNNAVQATHFINTILPNPVSAQTVRNVLKQNGFSSVIKKKCPLLKKRHWADRLKFAKYHENWTVEDWKRVLWLDETKINRIGSDGRVYTWKERGSPLSDCITSPTVKHGGRNNLIVWGCMGWNGVGKLIEVQGAMDSQQYYDILDDGVVESFEKLQIPEEERVFQQDNDPKHTSKKASQ